MKTTVKIFRYIEQLDCFTVDPGYKSIADSLGLTEWSAVVWIGRYFALDNDYGEHWFDNWKLRDELETAAKAIGIEYDDLLIIDPDRFKNEVDGPCHTGIERKLFWTDVLRMLELSLELIFTEARKMNQEKDKENVIDDLEFRINTIRQHQPANR